MSASHGIFILARFCGLTLITKILMRVILNAHAGRRFTTLDLLGYTTARWRTKGVGETSTTIWI